MAAGFQIGGAVYAHADALVVIQPRKPGAQRKTFLSAKSFEGDANLESFLLMGTSHEAVAIGVGVAKPDWKIGLEVWEEMLQYAALCGPGHQALHHDVTITFSQGSKTAKIELIDCIIEKGWGIKSEASGAPGIDVSGKARAFRMNGIDGFFKPGTPGSGGGGLSIGASVSIGGLSLGVSLSF